MKHDVRDERFLADMALEDANPEEFGAVMAICHAPWLLVSASS